MLCDGHKKAPAVRLGLLGGNLSVPRTQKHHVIKKGIAKVHICQFNSWSNIHFVVFPLSLVTEVNSFCGSSQARNASHKHFLQYIRIDYVLNQITHALPTGWGQLYNILR